MTEFIKEDLEFHIGKKTFKGLSTNYILEKIFDENIQKKWVPQEGDIIVGCTGNIFVISGKTQICDELGGTTYFFGGDFCDRDGDCFMESNYCYTMNESGIHYKWKEGKAVTTKDLYHSSYKDFRFVPYPHETNRM
jgi:hypothetical protein